MFINKIREKSAEMSQHNDEIYLNLKAWKNKPLLKLIYNSFYQLISEYICHSDGLIVELGSGIGNVKEVIPNCLRTDIFPNPWIDQQENAYKLSFESGTISNLIILDVFHHLRYPGTALEEFNRVLTDKGRVIVFEPYLSLFGLLIYGLIHHEDLGINEQIQWKTPNNQQIENDTYYAAAGNASRIFFGKKFLPILSEWNIIEKKRMSAVSYIASGGYSGPQLYPLNAYSIVKHIDKMFDLIPILFGTRCLIVLEKI